MTCSLFFSPSSVCFFGCDSGWKLDGPAYRSCVRRKWTREMPICRGKLLIDTPVSRPENFDHILDAEISRKELVPFWGVENVTKFKKR